MDCPAVANVDGFAIEVGPSRGPGGSPGSRFCCTMHKVERKDGLYVYVYDQLQAYFCALAI